MARGAHTRAAGGPLGAGLNLRRSILRRLALSIAILLAGALALGRPAGADAGPAPPRLNASAVALLSADTGELLLGTSADAELPIASATKLMTALITLERARLDAVFTEPQYYPAAADSQIGLVPGERMTVHDLMLALLLPSADDAAEDLAYNVGAGSVPRFLALMNARARQLGLTHTHYTTPIGLDTPGNYSSARDLVRLARYVLATQPFFRNAVALPHALLHSGAQPRMIVNRNDLVGAVPWITGVKTGHTHLAGYVLVGAGTQHGMTLISAVLGTPSPSERDAATLALLRYGFAAYRLATPVRAGAMIVRARVRGRPPLRAGLLAAAGVTRVVAAGVPIVSRVSAPAVLVGPLRRGARVGTLRVLAGRRLLATVPLVLAVSVPAPPRTLAGAVLAGTLVVALVMLLAVGLRVRLRRRRPQGPAVQVRRRR